VGVPLESQQGELMTWGSAASGKLFHGDSSSVFTPRRVALFAGQFVGRFVMTDSNAYAFTPAQVSPPHATTNTSHPQPLTL
jgi:hypothetical protein